MYYCSNNSNTEMVKVKGKAWWLSHGPEMVLAPAVLAIPDRQHNGGQTNPRWGSCANLQVCYKAHIKMLV